jgi:hypothetical protein
LRERGGEKTHVIEEKELMKNLIDCGWTVEYNKEERYTRLTQPVMIQSFRDEFHLLTDGPAPYTPTETGHVVSKGERQMRCQLRDRRNIDQELANYCT